jgi:hypothetical protein
VRDEPPPQAPRSWRRAGGRRGLPRAGGVQHHPDPGRGDAREPPVTAVPGGARGRGGAGARVRPVAAAARTRLGRPPRRPLRLARRHLRLPTPQRPQEHLVLLLANA